MKSVYFNKRELDGILDGTITLFRRPISEDIREDEIVAIGEAPEAHGYYLLVDWVETIRLHEISTSDCEYEGLEVNDEIYNRSLEKAHEDILYRYGKRWDEELEDDKDYAWANNPMTYAYSVTLLRRVF